MNMQILVYLMLWKANRHS